jgi:hypothetical protein
VSRYPVARLRLPSALALCLFPAIAGGCLSTDVRTAPDPYFEYDGMWCATVNARFLDARAATLAALADLQMPVAREGRYRHGGFIDCLGPEDVHIRIHIQPLGSRYRPEADFCRIGVRVGGFGTHRALCARILGAVSHHLMPEAAVPVPPPGAAAPVPPPGAPATNPPPSPATGSPLPAQPVPIGN